MSDSAMAGYLPDEATAAAFADGWYRTGDVGWLEPEGWVHLTDRCKEMIKVSGFQVAPAEIEAVLHGHPAVVDCAVFGVPDERAGEVPVAAVQVRGRLRRHRRGARNGSSPTRWPPTSGCTTSSSSTPSRGRRRARCCAGPCGTSGLRPCATARRRLMDVRLSSEQVALRDAAAQVVDRLGVHAVAELDDRERAAKLDAAVDASGWRELRTATDDGQRPGPRRSRSPSSPRSSDGAWPTPPFLGATLAAELRRLAGAPPAAEPETVALRADLRRLARVTEGTVDGTGPWLPDASAVDHGVGARRRCRRLDASARSALERRRRRDRPDPARRPWCRPRDPSPRSMGRPGRSAPTTWRRGAASGWP